MESLPGKFPALPPGDFYCVGATLNLTPVPASVKMTITAPGRLTSGASSLLSVGEVAIPPTLLRNQYTAAALVAAGSADLDSARLITVVIGRDASGKVVGANFGRPLNLPATVSANTKFRTESRLPAPDGVPVKVDVYAVVEVLE